MSCFTAATAACVTGLNNCLLYSIYSLSIHPYMYTVFTHPLHIIYSTFITPYIHPLKENFPVTPNTTYLPIYVYCTVTLLTHILYVPYTLLSHVHTPCTHINKVPLHQCTYFPPQYTFIHPNTPSLHAHIRCTVYTDEVCMYLYILPISIYRSAKVSIRTSKMDVDLWRFFTPSGKAGIREGG
jgi:hypothetical protein